MPTYISIADIEIKIGGSDALIKIADPSFADVAYDVDLVNDAIDWAEGDVIQRCRGLAAAGLATWEATPALLPRPAKDAMLTLAVFGIHERCRAAQGYAIPKGVIAAKDAVYASFKALTEDGTTSWVSTVTPAQHLTQGVKVFTDGPRRTRGYQVRKLIG